jgi:hypothetical protein
MAIYIAAGFCVTGIFAIIVFVFIIMFFQRAKPNALGSVYDEELWKKRFNFRPQTYFEFCAREDPGTGLGKAAHLPGAGLVAVGVLAGTDKNQGLDPAAGDVLNKPGVGKYAQGNQGFCRP